MSHLHRNSQKRIYRAGAQYFITSVTFDRYPYFRNPILAELFVRDLWFARNLKEFDLFGYTVIPDHVHLMFGAKGAFNYSQIMHNVNRVFSLHANQIMFSSPQIEADSTNVMSAGDDIYHRLRWTRELLDLHERFIRDGNCHDHIPQFRWQQSFRDHIIRGHQDFLNHLEYIDRNPVKHGIVSDPAQYPFVWIQGMQEPVAPD